MTKQVVLSGIRATGKLHLGNYLGAIRQWVEMLDSGRFECLFFVATYHTLTTMPDPDLLRANLPEIVLDYLAAGLDPAQCTLFDQASVPEVTEISTLLGMLMPVNELLRCPTYKDKAEKNADNVNAGLLTYPVLMAADILAPKADFVPVGQDQLVHLEMTRSIAKRFNRRYGQTFPIPRAMEASAVRVPGLDGTGKMGKSEGNTINLTDSPEVIRTTVRGAVTDPAKIRKGDPGHPDICNVYALHGFVSSSDLTSMICENCQSGSLGCVDCKKMLADNIIDLLAPFQEKRSQMAANPDYVKDVLHEGGLRARTRAVETVSEMRDKMGIIRY